ncbi:18031_t:CDS:2, partial [Funneliformis geosporum]
QEKLGLISKPCFILLRKEKLMEKQPSPSTNPVNQASFLLSTFASVVTGHKMIRVPTAILSPDKEFRYLWTVIVTAAHWAGGTPYTSSYELAESCVFDKQSPVLLPSSLTKFFLEAKRSDNSVALSIYFKVNAWRIYLPNPLCIRPEFNNWFILADFVTPSVIMGRRPSPWKPWSYGQKDSHLLSLLTPAFSLVKTPLILTALTSMLLLRSPTASWQQKNINSLKIIILLLPTSLWLRYSI